MYFRLMQSNHKKHDSLEWACRVILTIHLFRIATGYLTVLQTDYQLTSPLIPKYTAYEIAMPFMLPSLWMVISFVAALWFYFFQKRIATIIIGGASLIGFEIWQQFYLQ